MKITWIGHDCFMVESGGCTIVVDPFEAGGIPGYKDYHLDADMVLVSHEHFDHNYRDAVTLSGRDCPLKAEIVEAFHDNCGGKELGPNKIIIIDDGSFRVGHFGDLGHMLDEAQIQTIGHLDAAMINVGGFKGSLAPLADQVVRQLKPTWVFPAHFKTETFGFDGSGTLQEFLDLQQNGMHIPGSSLELTKEEGTHTVILDGPVTI
ncbi:MAG: MBL fold metallo-hydrolase [Lachnospiraceae bacterium]|nr:MBL fold metallo-hydrolase [Lachnospiraceae bacterium]